MLSYLQYVLNTFLIFTAIKSHFSFLLVIICSHSPSPLPFRPLSLAASPCPTLFLPDRQSAAFMPPPTLATGLWSWRTCGSCPQGPSPSNRLSMKSMFIIVKPREIVAKSQFLLNNHKKIIWWNSNVTWIYFILFYFFATKQFSHSVSYNVPFHQWELDLKFHVSIILSLRSTHFN